MPLWSRCGVSKVANCFFIFAFRTWISEVDCYIGAYSGIGHCVATQEKSDSEVNVDSNELKQKLTSIENYEHLG